MASITRIAPLLTERAPRFPLGTRRLALLTLCTSALLAACGGGNDDTTTPAPAPVAPVLTTVSGAVVKGPVSGAEVCAYLVAANARGAALGDCAITDADGRYTLSLPADSGALWLEASGGSYTDEATAALATLPAGSVLAVLATANGGEVTAMLTPLTTLALNAARAAAGGTGTLDAAAFQAAVADLLATFSLPATLDPATTLPVFGSSANAYGEALLNISRMIAAGTPLADLLATADPATLQAAFDAAANGSTPTPGAPLVISGATPASLNGTLGQETAQFESGSSDETSTAFDDSQPYCRVAVYGLLNSGDNTLYFLEIPYRKTDRQIGLLKFGLDADFSTLARTLNPTTGVSVDIANRRITFNNLSVTSTGTTVILNGSIDYPTNAVPANRAACG